MQPHEVQVDRDHAGAGGSAGTLIRAFDVFDIALPPRRDLSWRGLRETLGEWSLVRVETDDGTVGWGEATALGSWGGDNGRYFGETPRTVRHMVCDVLGPRLADVDPFDLTEIHRRMDEVVRGHPYAKGAIDIALHDLQGKILGLPVHRLLGGLARPAVPVAHMVGIMSVDEAVHEAASAVADGVRTLQIKGTDDPDRDVAVVTAVRHEVGDAITLRLDANQGYRRLGPKGAIRAVRRLEEAGVDLVEQPVEGLGPMAEVRRASRVQIVADESCWQPADLIDIDRRGAADAISIYIGKAGGIRIARRIADLAETVGLPCDVNGSLESGVGNAANLALALTSPAVSLGCVIPVSVPAGCHGPTTAGRYFADDVVSAPFTFADGKLYPLERAGLGIEVDEEKVRHYAPT